MLSAAPSMALEVKISNVCKLQHDRSRRLPNWRSYQVMFPGTGLQLTEKELQDKAKSTNARVLWENVDLSQQANRLLHKKITNKEGDYLQSLEARRDKLKDLLASEKENIDTLKFDLERQKLGHVGDLKRQLLDLQQKQESERKQIVEECLAKRDAGNSEAQRQRLKTEYAEDLRVQIEMNAAIKQAKYEENALLSRLQSLQPWSMEQPSEPAVGKGSSNILNRQLTHLLDAQLAEKAAQRAKCAQEMLKEKQKAREAEEQEKIQASEMLSLQQANRRQLRRDCENQIRLRRQVLAEQERKRNFEEFLFQVKEGDHQAEAKNKKLQKQKEVLDYLEYVREFKARQKIQEVELQNLFKSAAEKEASRRQEQRAVETNARKISLDEKLAKQLMQIQSKRELSRTQLQTFGLEQGHFTSIFAGDESRQNRDKNVEHRRYLELQIANRREGVKQDFPKATAPTIASPVGPVIHPKSHPWRKMMYLGDHGVPEWNGKMKLQSYRR